MRNFLLFGKKSWEILTGVSWPLIGRRLEKTVAIENGGHFDDE